MAFARLYQHSPVPGEELVCLLGRQEPQGRPLSQRALGGSRMCFLTSSFFGPSMLRRPSLIVPSEASVLIFQKAGKVPELVHTRGMRHQSIALWVELKVRGLF